MTQKKIFLESTVKFWMFAETFFVCPSGKNNFIIASELKNFTNILRNEIPFSVNVNDHLWSRKCSSSSLFCLEDLPHSKTICITNLVDFFKLEGCEYCIIQTRNVVPCSIKTKIRNILLTFKDPRKKMCICMQNSLQKHQLTGLWKNRCFLSIIIILEFLIFCNVWIFSELATPGGLGIGILTSALATEFKKIFFFKTNIYAKYT